MLRERGTSEFRPRLGSLSCRQEKKSRGRGQANSTNIPQTARWGGQGTEGPEEEGEGAGRVFPTEAAHQWLEGFLSRTLVRQGTNVTHSPRHPTAITKGGWRFSSKTQVVLFLPNLHGLGSWLG